MSSFTLWLALGGLCLCGGFSVDEDAITQLPPTGEDAPQSDPALKADKGFLAAQEALKQAAAVPDSDPDQYGLEEAKQSATAQAFSEEADAQSLGDSMLSGDIMSFKKSHRNHHTNAIMGKLIMSDLFSNQELEDIKNALASHAKPHPDLGESNTHADPDHVTLAKGLSIALQGKAKAEEKVHAVQQQLERAKQQHASNIELNAASLNTCKKHVATLNAQSSEMHDKVLNANTKLQQAETRHHISKRGFELCDKQKKTLEAQVRSLKTSALEHLAQSEAKKSVNSNLSPCCQACAKLTHEERSLTNADCSGC